ncbi:hypothetical protein EG834_07090 [bacterium]|nr:hypothetical protein [bacterium]
MSEATTNNAAATKSASAQFEDDMNNLVKDIGDMFQEFAPKVGKAAEDLTGLMVMRVDPEKRADLDVMVEAGLAKNRAQAALKLIADGIKGNEPLYRNVERAREQIKALKGELKSILE